MDNTCEEELLFRIRLWKVSSGQMGAGCGKRIEISGLWAQHRLRANLESSGQLLLVAIESKGCSNEKG